jgi:hypothetical protein
MNRYQIALGIKPPPKPSPAPQPSEWPRGRPWLQQVHRPGSAAEAFYERQHHLSELERQHIMADQAFSDRYMTGPFDTYISQDRTP